MATSTIMKKQLTGFAPAVAVTLPKKFETSGVLMIFMNPTSSSSGAYVIVNDATTYVFSVGSGGASGTFSLPIAANATVSQTEISNCNVTYIFKALA